MTKILLDNVSKRYGKFAELAVSDFNLEIEDQEFLVFLGPSGCGKSTTLRMIAGLEDISGGEIYIGDTLVNDIPPKDRDISMVFQNYALYPNLTVFENIAFGLRIRKLPKYEIEETVRRTARVLEISNFLDRKPRELSGGQRQRVALGRAIVRQPQAFLMDEPLSNLDAKLRVQMRAEIIRLHKEIGVTTIYVTHDQIEAMTMGGRIVVMNRGIIQQVDSPEEVYNRPKNLFVAKFIGNQPMNFFDGKVETFKGEMRFFSKSFNVVLSDEQAHMFRNKNMERSSVIMGIRPEHINLEREAVEQNPGSVIKGDLEFNEFIGSDNYYHLSTYGKETFTVRANPRYRYDEGDNITTALDMSKALFFDNNTEELLDD